jgi:hypothetical protein
MLACCKFGSWLQIIKAMSYELLELFEDRVFRNEEEKEFLTALVAHADEWFEFGLTDQDCYLIYDAPTVTVAFDICDFEKSVVLRCLRIDFTGSSLLLGYDDSMQYVCPLSADNPDVKSYLRAEYTPKDFAEIAAKWLVVELSRKIERREWRNGSILHQQYVVEDTNQPLNWSDSENKKRYGLGTPTATKIVFPLKKD